MFAITIPTAPTTLTGQLSRAARWVRGRPRPPARTLRSGRNWKVKTRWILGAWAVTSAISVVGIVLTPALIAFPIVLIALTPRLPFLFMAAATTNLLLFFGVVVPDVVDDPIHVALGRRYGARAGAAEGAAADGPPRRGRDSARPTSRVIAAAGICRMRTSRIVIADVVGTSASG